MPTLLESTDSVPHPAAHLPPGCVACRYSASPSGFVALASSDAERRARGEFSVPTSCKKPVSSTSRMHV